MLDFEKKKLSVTPVRMGRPPIGKFTAVRLSPEMLAQIDAIIGPGQRAAFIRDAVERELKRRKQKG